MVHNNTKLTYLGCHLKINLEGMWALLLIGEYGTACSDVQLRKGHMLQRNWTMWSTLTSTILGLTCTQQERPL